MAAVRMYIDKFKGVVLIDDNHPLAVAQRARGPVTADPPVESARATPDAPAATVPSVAPVAVPTRRRRR
jgi:hypothetical protein